MTCEPPPLYPPPPHKSSVLCQEQTVSVPPQKWHHHYPAFLIPDMMDPSYSERSPLTDRQEHDDLMFYFENDEFLQSHKYYNKFNYIKYSELVEYGGLEGKHMEYKPCQSMQLTSPIKDKFKWVLCISLWNIYLDRLAKFSLLSSFHWCSP